MNTSTTNPTSQDHRDRAAQLNKLIRDMRSLANDARQDGQPGAAKYFQDEAERLRALSDDSYRKAIAAAQA